MPKKYCERVLLISKILHYSRPSTSSSHALIGGQLGGDSVLNSEGSYGVLVFLSLWAWGELAVVIDSRVDRSVLPPPTLPKTLCPVIYTRSCFCSRASSTSGALCILLYIHLNSRLHSPRGILTNQLLV